MCWFSMILKVIGKFCFIIFHANGHFLLFCVFFFCNVWYVIATSSYRYLPQLQKNVTSNIYFGTPRGYKGSILPEVI